jgi:peptidoglycan L-alanyl-D-glutamate endopeptidase CwlK
MTYRYGKSSTRRLQSCDPDLILLFNQALADPACPSDITILEGHRGEERQYQMVAEGKSQLRWPKSRHNSFPSMAVDAAPYVGGAISWSWPHYYPLADHIKATWARLKAEGKVHGELEWGGDWSFKDGPHWQINR